jgi:hypothetical protein
MLENNNQFGAYFLKKFTRELIKNSTKTDKLSSQKLLRERIKQRIEERLKERRETQ